MKFGVSFLPDVDPGLRSPVQYFRDLIRLSVQAETLGYDYVKMTEHYLGDYGGHCPSPMMFLSAVAVETQDIRLMTGGILPVFHHPIQIASHAGMLDALSDGRLELGFARGFLPYEYAAFQIPMSESRDRFWVTVDAVRRLLSSEDVSISRALSRLATMPPRGLWCGGFCRGGRGGGRQELHRRRLARLWALRERHAVRSCPATRPGVR